MTLTKKIAACLCANMLALTTLHNRPEPPRHYHRNDDYVTLAEVVSA
uniref:ARAD1A17512p n=1 Tax=Blastobotrys adeninivorans TaxID=409370 RepID=A0A060T3N6_BLAAD